MSFLGLMTVRAHEAVVADAKRELEQLATSIWRAEFRRDAPNWSPSPYLCGLISQVDNMYAGVRSQRDEQADRANKLTVELEAVKAERDAILRDKKRETSRRTEAVSHGISLLREVQSLTPDAQKWRDRKQADRDYRAGKRAKAVRLEAAEPPHAIA